MQLNHEDKLIIEKMQQFKKESIIYIGFINSKSINQKEFFNNLDDEKRLLKKKRKRKFH